MKLGNFGSVNIWPFRFVIAPQIFLLILAEDQEFILDHNLLIGTEIVPQGDQNIF
jgi:hypothetical protein